ncbi:hypothetical protein AVEN_260325-1 [Araneus ventricosus]|uniref:Uncharacterized protein n=1 Tax=Araneus ventricosus TaxID=182803 RepID=A0A4Y2QK49_ARAVE|nr:hypothetical protein AVEN_260325-1 [Araneus ventricosus]
MLVILDKESEEGDAPAPIDMVDEQLECEDIEFPQLDQVQESARPQKTIGERFMVKEESAACVGTRPWTTEGRSLTLSIAFML